METVEMIVKVLLVKMFSDTEPSFALLEVTSELQRKFRFLRDEARALEKRLNANGIAYLNSIVIPGSEPDLFDFDREMDSLVDENDSVEVSFAQSVLLRDKKDESQHVTAGELHAGPDSVYWVCWGEDATYNCETAPVTYEELGIED